MTSLNLYLWQCTLSKYFFTLSVCNYLGYTVQGFFSITELMTSHSAPIFLHSKGWSIAYHQGTLSHPLRYYQCHIICHINSFHLPKQASEPWFLPQIQYCHTLFSTLSQSRQKDSVLWVWVQLLHHRFTSW